MALELQFLDQLPAVHLGPAAAKQQQDVLLHTAKHAQRHNGLGQSCSPMIASYLALYNRM